ncbi:energy transducer TonB [Flavobacterium terrigena]|uniref:Protein TonB n=1 Tax=Flavobacterium terrigena TaxID=402734 RepID=A0A1H6S5C2_9FLAO|nr:energy transducer TonB [Flavobacterium terrigena]SEI59987.1 protein TonB [Flavobacterium terrigena]
MSNFNVQDEKWLEIAFENRNKAYGAYQLRKESDATTIKAMLITFGALAFGIGLFSFTTPEPKPIIEPKPNELPDFVRIVELTPVAEPNPIIRKGTDNPRLNLTPDKVPPVVVDRPNVKPIEEPEKPDNSTPFNPNGDVNGNPGPIGDPKGIEIPLPANPGTETGTSTTTIYRGTFGVEASFPGGINKFRTFIAENYKVPSSFNKDVLSIELVFIIEKDGSMTDIRMVSKGDKALEKEAIRVLKAMNKKWTPGKVNGEIVRSEKRLPIQISLVETED